VDPKVLLIGLIGGICVIASVLVQRSIKRKAQIAVAGRQALADDEFGNRFFSAERRVIAAEARRLLRPYIRVDYKVVLPDDELVKDLQLAAIDGLDANGYLEDLEKAFGVKIPDSDSTRWRTLRHIVDGIHGYTRPGTNAVNRSRTNDL
jgi:acyl carrier protein